MPGGSSALPVNGGSSLPWRLCSAVNRSANWKIYFLAKISRNIYIYSTDTTLLTYSHIKSSPQRAPMSHDTQ